MNNCSHAGTDAPATEGDPRAAGRGRCNLQSDCFHLVRGQFLAIVPSTKHRFRRHGTIARTCPRSKPWSPNHTPHTHTHHNKLFCSQSHILKFCSVIVVLCVVSHDTTTQFLQSQMCRTSCTRPVSRVCGCYTQRSIKLIPFEGRELYVCRHFIWHMFSKQVVQEMDGNRSIVHGRGPT